MNSTGFERAQPHARIVICFLLIAQLHVLSCYHSLGENSAKRIISMRPITERSAVERYRTDSEADTHSITDSNQGVSRPSLRPTNVISKEKANPIQQAQFQFPTPESNSAEDPGFLDGGSGNATLESTDEESLMPFPTDRISPLFPETTRSAEPAFKAQDSSAGRERELPRNVDATTDDLPSQDVPAYAPFSVPDSSEQYATMNNSTFVSPPSNYIAATSWGRNCKPKSVGTGMPHPIEAASNIKSPMNGLVGVSTGTLLEQYPSIPDGPFMTMGQERTRVVVGQGIVGQPVAYVPGQWVRNSLRYLFP
ncbi:MAG: hypothetical protein VXZ38_08450 [Planctomycetota bacterium]|nr:hypothetical protein [Planctomycetota bacterium]